ncbi:hypothetical protein KJ966_14950 [bacterium]|nr:hypothetical protein [bacterium]
MKIESHSYFLGVDVGATKTAYVIANNRGEVAHVLYDKGANHELYGIEGSEENLKAGIEKIVRKAGLTSNDLDYIFYGAAGADTEDDFTLLRAMYKRITPDIPFDFENDGLIALKSGTIDGKGIVITCGSGNTNFAANGKGKIKRIGGLAPHSGDLLGAYCIAGYACSAAVRSEDGRDYPSVLTKLFLQEFEVNAVEELSNIGLTSPNVERMIRILFEAAEMGDGKALEITWMLVKEILTLVKEFHHALFSPDEKIKLVLEGAVFKAKFPPLIRMLELAVHQKYKATIVIPEWDPALGALFFALEKNGIPLDKALTDTIIRTYLERKDTA